MQLKGLSTKVSQRACNQENKEQTSAPRFLTASAPAMMDALDIARCGFLRFLCLVLLSAPNDIRGLRESRTRKANTLAYAVPVEGQVHSSGSDRCTDPMPADVDLNTGKNLECSSKANRHSFLHARRAAGRALACDRKECRRVGRLPVPRPSPPALTYFGVRTVEGCRGCLIFAAFLLTTISFITVTTPASPRMRVSAAWESFSDGTSPVSMMSPLLLVAWI